MLAFKSDAGFLAVERNPGGRKSINGIHQHKKSDKAVQSTVAK
jgi:hypothetical protein